MPSSGRFKSSTGIWRYSALGSDFGSETNSWRTAREPVNLTLDFEHAHVSCHSFSRHSLAKVCRSGQWAARH